MKTNRQLLLCSLLSALACCFTCTALEAKTQPPKKVQPIVYSFQVDRDSNLLVISGENLHDGNSPPTATLAGFALINQYFDPADPTALAYELPDPIPDGHPEVTLDCPKGFIIAHIGSKVSDSLHADVADYADSAGDALTLGGYTPVDLDQSAALEEHSNDMDAHLPAYVDEDRNSAFGELAAQNCTSGHGNTAVGYSTFQYNQSGSNNTAIGLRSMGQSKDGSYNVGIGYEALYYNEGAMNIAIGDSALWANRNGNSSIAIGSYALMSSDHGYHNLAVGDGAMYTFWEGSYNSAFGQDTLGYLQSGSNNCAVGAWSMETVEVGNENTAVGYSALSSWDERDEFLSGNGNTCVGNVSLGLLHDGNDNVAMGNMAGYNLKVGNSNLYLSNPGQREESGMIRIGADGTHTGAFMAGIHGAHPEGETQFVVINAEGQLGTSPDLMAVIQAQAEEIAELRAAVAELQQAMNALVLTP